MIDVDIFRERVTALWDSQKRMAAARKWKSGKRAGQIKTPAITIQFTKKELEEWLWEEVGCTAVPCAYCHRPVDIISLTLDHKMPRSAGGEASLDNLAICCNDDNHSKGNMTAEGYLALLDCANHILSPYDRGILLGRLKDANAGSRSRFFRDKREKPPEQPVLPKPAQQMQLSEPF